MSKKQSRKKSAVKKKVSKSPSGKDLQWNPDSKKERAERFSIVKKIMLLAASIAAAAYLSLMSYVIGAALQRGTWGHIIGLVGGLFVAVFAVVWGILAGMYKPPR